MLQCEFRGNLFVIVCTILSTQADPLRPGMGWRTVVPVSLYRSSKLDSVSLWNQSYFMTSQSLTPALIRVATFTQIPSWLKLNYYVGVFNDSRRLKTCIYQSILTTSTKILMCILQVMQCIWTGKSLPCTLYKVWLHNVIRTYVSSTAYSIIYALFRILEVKGHYSYEDLPSGFT